ncbi:MAG: hypothetical protein KDC38_14765 [Planctomycetes bacterium]|nr:hypothetical protein [Planctomycetota bacterium]
MHTRALWISSLLVLMIGALLVSGLERVETDPKIDSRRLDSRSPRRVDNRSGDSPQDRVESTSAPVSTPARTLRDTLEDFWGDDWEQARDALAEIDLDVPYEVVPWEIASREVEDQLFVDEGQARRIADQLTAWPSDPATEQEWVASRYRVPEIQDVDWTAIHENIDHTNEAIENLARRFVDVIDETLLENWDTGRFRRSPATLAGTESPYQGKLVFTKTFATGGWAVAVGVERHATPELEEIQARIQRLRRERHQRIMQILHPNLLEHD